MEPDWQDFIDENKLAIHIEEGYQEEAVQNYPGYPPHSSLVTIAYNDQSETFTVLLGHITPSLALQELSYHAVHGVWRHYTDWRRENKDVEELYGEQGAEKYYYYCCDIYVRLEQLLGKDAIDNLVNM